MSLADTLCSPQVMYFRLTLAQLQSHVRGHVTAEQHRRVLCSQVL